MEKNEELLSDKDGQIWNKTVNINMFKKELSNKNLSDEELLNFIIRQSENIHQHYFESDKKREKLESLTSMGLLTWAMMLFFAFSFFKYWLLISAPVLLAGSFLSFKFKRKIKNKENETEQYLKQLSELIQTPEYQFRLLDIVKKEKDVVGEDHTNYQIYELKMLFLDIKKYGLSRHTMKRLGNMMRSINHHNFNPKKELEELTTQYEEYSTQKENPKNLKEML